MLPGYLFLASIKEAKRAKLLKGPTLLLAWIPSRCWDEDKRFTGGKADVGCDGPSQIIVAVGDLAGDEPDAKNALTMVEQAQETTALPVAQTTGDCAYGRGGTRKQFAEAGPVLYAKVPQEHTGTGLFPKSRFEVDLHNQTVTRPAGQRTSEFREDKAGGRVFSFGAEDQGNNMFLFRVPPIANQSRTFRYLKTGSANSGRASIS